MITIFGRRRKRVYERNVRSEIRTRVLDDVNRAIGVKDRSITQPRVKSLQRQIGHRGMNSTYTFIQNQS